jgi:hypothetical protein
MVEVPEKFNLRAKGMVIGERSTTVTGLDSTGRASRRPKNTELEAENMIAPIGSAIGCIEPCFLFI